MRSNWIYIYKYIYRERERDDHIEIQRATQKCVHVVYSINLCSLTYIQPLINSFHNYFNYAHSLHNMFPFRLPGHSTSLSNDASPSHGPVGLLDQPADPCDNRASTDELFECPGKQKVTYSGDAEHNWKKSEMKKIRDRMYIRLQTCTKDTKYMYFA